MIGDNKDIECFRIGVIDFTDIESISETQIQSKKRFNTKSIGECIIEVYANEGPIPHFHLYNQDKYFESCIRIYENLYFSHGGKYKDTLNSKQCRQLNEYLKTPYTKIPGANITLWQAIVFSWELATKYEYPKKCKTQPHYEDMTLFKDVI